MPLVDDGLIGLLQFIRFMATRPDSVSVVDALMFGPLARFGARACHLYRYEEPGQLVLYGNRGHEDALMDRSRVSPLVSRTPMTEAFLNNAITVMSLGEMLRSYPDVRIGDDGRWQRYADDEDDMLVSAAISMNGVAVGAYTVFLPVEYQLRADDCILFEGLGALLGLWMTHDAQVRVLRPMEFPFAEDDTSPTLTERQATILGLIGAGRSVSAISRALGFSQSTIRQELRRSMRRLHAVDRHDAVERARGLGYLGEGRAAEQSTGLAHPILRPS